MASTEPSPRIRRIAVLTSGSDGPGLNACLRAVVRAAIHEQGWEVWGVPQGFLGLVRGEFRPLDSRSVSHIIEKGGTFLGVSPSAAFGSPHTLREALRNLNEQAVDALVVIGGDGSQRGALAIQQAGFATVGVPATIENDVCGTDLAIGVDTALNTALETLDRIKDTASSQQQAFLLELAGEKCGYQALMAGIAGGAEMACIPEVPYTIEDVAQQVAHAYVRGKRHCIITVAAGATPSALELREQLITRQQELGFSVSLCTIAPIQRGGSPSAHDRYLATRLGAEAVAALSAGQTGVLVGMVAGELVRTPLSDVAGCVRPIDAEYLEMARVLAL
jgi:6-phosphofructokinase 1